MSDPIVESQIRSLQAGRAERDRVRSEAAAKLAERQKDEEQRTCISPRDVERQAQAKATWDYWENIYKAEQEREYHRERNAAIKEMARLYEEWQKRETSKNRQAEILRQYSELYRKCENVQTRKPTTTSDETILAYWLSEKRKAALARIYGTGKSNLTEFPDPLCSGK